MTFFFFRIYFLFPAPFCYTCHCKRFFLAPQEVIEDIEQVFANCRAYNRDDAEEYQCGMRLERYFTKEARKLGLLEQDEENSAPAAPKAKEARRTY